MDLIEDRFEEVCAIVESGRFLAPVLAEMGIRASTFYYWLDQEPGRRDRYQFARDHGEEMIAASAIEIADDARNDYMEKLGRDGQPAGYVLNGEHVQRSKLRMDARLRTLPMFNPKRWGPKSEVAVSVTSHEDFLAKIAAEKAAEDKPDDET